MIEDEETMQLKILSTDIEKVNIKEIDNVESEESDTEEIDKIQISDEVIIIDRKIYDDDYQVNKDADQGTREKESEGKYGTERRKKDSLESDISEPDERDQREKRVLFKRTKTPTKGDENDLVHTDNDEDTNNKESEEKYQREVRKKENLDSDHSETDGRDQIENEALVISK